MRPPVHEQVARQPNAVTISAAEFESALMRAAVDGFLSGTDEEDEEEEHEEENEGGEEDEVGNEETRELEESDNESIVVAEEKPVVKKVANKQTREARAALSSFLPDSPSKVLATYQMTLARVNGDDHEKMFQDYERDARRQVEERIAAERKYTQERLESQRRRRAELEQRITELQGQVDNRNETDEIDKTIRDLEALPDVASVRVTKLGVIITTKNLYSTQKCPAGDVDSTIVYDMPRVYMGTYKIYFKINTRGTSQRRKPFIKCLDKERFHTGHPFFNGPIRNYSNEMCYGTFEDVLATSLTRGNIVHATITTLMVLKSLNVTAGYNRNLAQYLARNKSLPVDVKLGEGDRILVKQPMLFAGFSGRNMSTLLTEKDYPARVTEVLDGGAFYASFNYCYRHEEGDEEHASCVKESGNAQIFANSAFITKVTK